jgi:predicted permease
MRLPGRRRDELDEEIRSHLRMAIRDRVERGETPEQAEAAARREFGNVGLVKEVTREMWGWGWWERLLQDIRYGLRFMRRGPGFTAVAVLTLALGIGANTAIFSVVDAVLLRNLPVKEPAQLVLFRSIGGDGYDIGAHNGSITRDSSGQTIKSSFPYQTYTRFREQQSALSEVFAFGTLGLNVNAFGQADVASGQAVSGNYYTALGVPAVVGRTLTDDDDNAAAPPVAVITHRYWLSRFGGDPAVIGQQINLNHNPFTIVGVTPPGFNGTLNVGTSPDITIPIAWESQLMAERSRMKNNMWWLRLMGRLKPGVSMEEAQSQLSGVFQQSVVEHRAARISRAQAEGREAPAPLDQNAPPRLAAFPGNQGETNTRLDYQVPLSILFIAVGLVLLIACANVANLLLARAASRQREIAVRLALGAGRGRLIRQLLTESLLLATLGGAFGLLLAFWFKDGLLAVSDWGGQQMSALDARLDLRVLVFTVALSWAAGLLFGLAPAWRATRVDLAPSLKDNFRSAGSSPRSLFTKALIVAQVALSLLLMIGAGLFLNTLINLRRVDPGFNPSDLLLFEVEPGLSGYQKEPLANLYRQMSERIEAVPGVRSVTFSANPLLARSATELALYLPSTNAAREGNASPAGAIHVHQVRENFLGAMEIPLLGGRAFTTRDDARAPRVAIVNQSFAKQFLPDGSPIGKRFGLDPAEADGIEIIGLALDAKYTSQRDQAPPTIYLPWEQELSALGSATFEVRTSGDPSLHVAAIRQAVREVDRDLPLKGIKTQAEQADETLAMERLFARLFSLFGLLALVLAAVGLYGMLAWSVTQRQHEIGIRVALGASRSSVMKMILHQGLTLTLLGVVLGLAGASVLAKNLQSLSHMLYGIEPTDLLTFGGIALFLMLVALVACYIPARRATKVDPLVALRYE